ncbi:MAG: NAD(P)/FAD-dependent oxidoreductase [Clostridia bacterium]|nr:NAD(P)/FAD-dependent oxidoreductase [Clostridia bacterium]
MRVIVIGAGASGLMAAGVAAKKDDVLVIEKNDRAGRKLAITGKGRCNITNAADIGDFIDMVPGNGKFLYSAFYSFTNEDVIAFFRELGVETKVERGGRVFPVSDSAKDVVNALVKFCRNTGVKFRYNSSVKRILTENKAVKGVILQDGSILECDKVIVATGGKSYPATGSTGAGYRFAEEAGHRVLPIKPSLVGLAAKEGYCKELQGLSLKNVAFTLKTSVGKEIYSDFGEMLFTHFGVSGPIVLSGSRWLHPFMKEDRSVTGVKAEIDLKPALEEEQLDKRLLRDFEKYQNKQIKNALFDLLPEKLIPVVIALTKIEEEKKVNEITKEERKRMVEILKHFPLTIAGLRPIDEAIITAGGVCVDEIDPGTMESKLVKGLYFCGEVLDLDAYTGGFNLQIAFSTGYLAGQS